MHPQDFLLHLKQKNLFFQMPGYFLNEIDSCVDDSLVGYVRAHSHLELVGRAVIARSQIPSVAVISGNGSGHEPAMVSGEK
jgi:dihydroxyacetone kinase